MRTKAEPIDAASISAEADEGLVRVYVWELPIRITHWVFFLSIVVLSFTGYYLYYPFIVSRGTGAFTMATMRFIHVLSGFALIVAFLVRVYWFFMGNKWAGWRDFLPRTLVQRRDFWGQLQYYLFTRKDPSFRVGHNPLAGLTYTIIYLLIFIEILTGLALYNHVLGSPVLGFFVDWSTWFASYRTLRLIHFLIGGLCATDREDGGGDERQAANHTKHVSRVYVMRRPPLSSSRLPMVSAS